MIIKKSASWISDYSPMSVSAIKSSATPILDKRVNDLILFKMEINNQIQTELDFIYVEVERRIKVK